MAVVKADAYGHGVIAVARRLEQEGVDWFGVALPEEGLQLRNAGINTPILCLGGLWPGQDSGLVDNQITPVVYKTSQLEALDKIGRGRGIRVDLHVKIDTGMGRVGIPFDEAAEFADAARKFSNICIDGLLTHFAAAENPDETAFTTQQIDRFDAACEAFRLAGHSLTWIDLANSPAAITCPAARGNLVRLGGAIYGLLDDILPPATERPELKAALSLRSEIAYLRDVLPGESVGYGRTFTTERPTKIALVPIGYADGYPRGLSNIGFATIRGTRAPIVGRISMDWTMFDVTEIEGVTEADEVVLIGSKEGEPTAADIARLVGTIGYEITCGITPRVPRVFR